MDREGLTIERAGPTPNGGVRSFIRWHSATAGEIVEVDAQGREIMRIHFTVNGSLSLSEPPDGVDEPGR